MDKLTTSDLSAPSLQRWILPVLSATNFVIGMGAFMAVGMMNPLAQDLSISTVAAGWLMTSYAIGYAILSPLLVSLSGKIGRRRVLATGIAVFGIANLCAAMSPNEYGLYAARVLASAGAGVVSPIAASVAAALSTPQRRASALAAVFFGMTLAQIFGVPLGSFVAYTFGWRTAFLLVFALAVPCVYLLWKAVPAGLSFQTTSLRDLGRTLRDVRTMFAVLFTGTFMGAIFVLFTYLAPLLAETQGYQRNGITMMLVATGIGAVFGNLAGGRITDAIGSYKTLLTLSCLQVLITPIFSFLPFNTVLLLLLILVWSAFGWSFMAAQQLRLLQIAPNSANVVLALHAAAIYIGAAVGAAIGGWVLNTYSLTALGMAGGLTALMAVAHIMISEHKLKSR